MEFFYFLCFFVYGILVGSFLNVVIIRFRNGESLGGRSHCVSCKKEILWYDLLPLISFLLLLGKCRFCGKKLSRQYPIVEGSTGLLFILSGYFFFPHTFADWGVLISLWVMLSVFFVIFVYDLKYMEIPMTAFWIGLGATISFFAFLQFPLYENVFESFLALKGNMLFGIILFGIFWSLSYFSRETWMGSGDAYLVFWLAFLLGFPIGLWALAFASLLGSFFGLYMMKKKGKMVAKTAIPFGPYIIFTTVFFFFLMEAGFFDAFLGTLLYI